MMPELALPCPFCGQPNPSVYQAGGYWKIKCVDGCDITINGSSNKANIIDAWNRRPNKTPHKGEPLLVRAGDRRVLLRGEPPKVDVRVLAEDYYQGLLSGAGELIRAVGEFLKGREKLREMEIPFLASPIIDEMERAWKKLTAGEGDLPA